MFLLTVFLGTVGFFTLLPSVFPKRRILLTILFENKSHLKCIKCVMNDSKSMASRYICQTKNEFYKKHNPLGNLKYQLMVRCRTFNV